MTQRNTAIAIGLVVGLVTLILLPVNLHLNYIPYFDKFAHFAACGLLTLALTNVISIRKAVLIVFIAATAAEWLQFYIPHRGPSMGDFIANTVGILGAWVVYISCPYVSFFQQMKKLGYSPASTLQSIKFLHRYNRRNRG